MCLSTAYIDSGKEKKELMKDVARMEADADGFSLFDLFGERTFVRGRIKSIDFVQEHSVVFEDTGAGTG